MYPSLHGRFAPGDTIAVTFLAIVTFAACATARKSELPAIPKGPVVAEILVEGNRAFSDGEIISAIYSEATSKVLFWDKRYLDTGELETDQARVANFYRLHGYFDVVVNPIQIVPHRRALFREERPTPGQATATLDIPIPGPGVDTPLVQAGSVPTSPQHLPPSPTLVPNGESIADSAKPPPPGKPAPGSTTASSPGDGMGTEAWPTGAQAAIPPQRPDATATREASRAGKLEAGTGRTLDPAELSKPTARPEPSRVALVIQVEEGTRYRVKEVRVDVETRGGEPSGHARVSPEHDYLRALVTRQIRLREGAFFDLRAQQADEAAIQRALLQASHAWAKVSSEIILLPKEGAVRLRYHVDAGPLCFFGKVRITGLEQVDERIVMLRVRRHLAPGSPFRQDTIVQLQKALYDLQLFQSVTVLPAETSRDKPTVDVEVTVGERAFKQIRVGGGLKQETNWQEIAAHTSWANRYFSGRLIRLSLDALAGWGFSPGLQSRRAYTTADCTEQGCSSEGRNGPILDMGADFSLPDFKGRRVTAGASARFRVGQTLSYGYMSPKLELTASRQLDRHLAAGFGTGMEQYLPTPDEPSRTAFSTGDLEGEDSGTIRFEGLLTYLQQSFSYDRRDHILAPERGLYAAVVFQEAGLFGDFAFVKVVPDLRVYVPIVPDRLILGVRYSTGAIVPISGKSAPPVLYFELGGGSTVRGIPWNALTYYTGAGCEIPSPVPDSDNQCSVATGGTVFHLANLEVRVPLGEMGVVAFGDAGHVALASDQVLRAWATPSPNDFLLSVGVGLRYRTPVGPVRLDFGYRVHEPVPLAPGLAIVGGGGCRCGIHLAIGEAF